MTFAEPTLDEIERVAGHLVTRKRVRESSGPHVVADCVFCGKKAHLTMNLGNGLFDCKVCGEAGSLWRLADQLGVRLREKKSVVRSSTSVLKTGLKKLLGPERSKSSGVTVGHIDTAHARLWSPDDEDGQKVLAYLRGRGIDDDAIKHFKLGVAYIREGGVKDLSVGIPYLDEDRVALVKMRNITPECDKGRRYRRTKGGQSAMFNASGTRDRRRVVLVEGELDAISLWQCGVTSVASTSLGAKGDVPEEWKEALASADDIVLWYDDDEAGDNAVTGLSASFGTHRVRIASIPDALATEVQERVGKRPKDVNDLVCGGVAPEVIAKIVDNAISLDVGSVVKPGAYSDAMGRVIEASEQSLGVSTGWPSLDELLRGWRPGEMTMLTGHTSHGKTSWGTAAMESLARRGHPVLITSLEEGPEAIVRRMLQRRFKRPLSTIRTDAERAEAYAALESIDEDPVWIFDAYGRVALDDLIDGITYAVHRLGVRHVLVDHLHFIQKPDRVDGVEWLDKVALDFAALAVNLQIHIVLLAHPRAGVETTQIPTGDSLKGSSSLKQAAFNGITVFRVRDKLGGETPGQVKLKDGDGRKVEIPLEPRDALLYVWKRRHPESKEGAAVLEFRADRLAYLEKPVPGAPASDDATAKWEESADAGVAGVDPDDDLFGGT